MGSNQTCFVAAVLGPGTGASQRIRNILKRCQRQNVEVAVACPTGYSVVAFEEKTGKEVEVPSIQDIEIVD